MSHHRLLTEALRAAFPTGKHLAIAGGVSVHTADRYRRGETYPDVFTLARLMRASRGVAEAMLRMAGLDDLSLDLEQARLVRELADLQQKRAARHADMAATFAAAGVALPPELAAIIDAGGGDAAAAVGPAGGAVPPRGAR